MTYAELVKKFLGNVLAIFNSNPKRREPGDGSDGYCDCIGLIIGAIRRMGLKWTGIHGSNWCARKELVNFSKINNISDLAEGDIVLKGRAQGESKWDLPSRYRKGGKYYNGDLTDYYHAGVVYSLNPFQIRHMSSKMTIDTKLGKWNYRGKSRQIVEAAGGVAAMPTSSSNTPATGTYAILVAPSGKTVNFRKSPTLRGSLIDRVPLGTKIEIVSPGEEWAKVKYNGKTGYMMAKFLDIIGDGKGQY